VSPTDPRGRIQTGGQMPPSPAQLAWRMEVVERHLEKQDEAAERLVGKLDTINDLMTDMNGRLKKHDESRAMWSKIYVGVATAIAIGLVGFLLKISYIVQSSKLP
jgi:hypothetical protein